MTRNQMGFIYAACFILMGLFMFGLHWLITGISDDFGTGIVIGMALGMGLLGLASRRVREAP